jgi:imidazolonepropionase-like amidohydrolase
MPVLKVRGYALPDGEPIELFADGDRWTSDPVKNAELVGEGWLVPGLVDVHTHPGAEEPPDPLDENMLRDDLHRHVASGVTLIRSPGLAGEPPTWFGKDADVPRAVHAGQWIAQHGQFVDGWGTRSTLDDFPRVAAAQARKTEWVKLVADWGPEDDPLPLDVLRAVVEAVHAEGARVAVHSQNAVSGAAAIAAHVDSLEHGMGLPTGLLARMAEQGTALTPTLSVFLSSLPEVQRRPESARREWYVNGTLAHPGLVAAAGEAGVTILAGTDSHPTGGIVDEIQALADTGLTAHLALGAGSWIARSYLGLPGLVDGGPADAVIYQHDPRNDLSELRRPLVILLRGKLAYRAR